LIGTWAWDNSLVDGRSYPIGWTEIEKSEGIPKSADHLSKPCGEEFSGDHDKIWILVRRFHQIWRDVRFSPVEVTSRVRRSISCKNNDDQTFHDKNSDDQTFHDKNSDVHYLRHFHLVVIIKHLVKNRLTSFPIKTEVPYALAKEIICLRITKEVIKNDTREFKGHESKPF
jgi:hypothetical protein